MQNEEFHKRDIALIQFKAAIWLFLNEIDFSSSITLAGAADDIFHALVLRVGKEPFVDLARNIHCDLTGNDLPKRKSYKHHIDKKLGIITHKHMGANCEEEVLIDLKNSASNAIKKALANHSKLFPSKDPLVEKYLQWCWVNENDEEMMEAYRSETLATKPNGQESNPVKYKIIDIAESQLKTSIRLFLAHEDYISAITLAGAADTLLCRLVSNSGERTFTEEIIIKEGDPSKTLEEMGREINDMFFINDLKHLDKGKPETIELDTQESAVGAILKALANYVTLKENKPDFVQAFVGWTILNLGPKA